MELQVLLDEWIALGHPVDELCEEIENQRYELHKLEEECKRPKRISNLTRSEVFNNTCSKYFFSKVKGIPGALHHMFNDSDVLVNTDHEILTICTEFYRNLYYGGNSPSCKLSNFSTPALTCYLSDEDRSHLAAEITKEDLEEALQKMKKGKSPGADGLTVEFYRKYWPLIGKLVYNSITFAQHQGEFTFDQRQGILKLLPKPHKDPRFVSHLRPITLLNVDYKLFTEVLADRLKLVLPQIIHTDQNGFIKNRFLGNNLLDVQTLIALAEETQDDNSVLLSLDIEKAFDSVRWDYLKMVLWRFGFLEQFIDWISLTHKNAHVCILNKGFLSDPILIKQGLAQGCGLSPFLFILAIEGLANTLRNDPRIPGFEVGGMTKKVSLVADNSLLSFIGSTEVITRVKMVLDSFSNISGLHLNYDKSILIGLGPSLPDWFQDPIIANIRKIHISEGFKYLGLVTSTNLALTQSNYEINPSMVETILESIPVRNTTISGRILQAKQLVISKFVYKFQHLPSPEGKALRLFDTVLYNHIWDHRRHRLSKDVMNMSSKEGGFGMVNVFVTNTALKFAWFNRLLSDTAQLQFWAIYLSHCFVLSIPDVLNCNINSSNLNALLHRNINLPPFWREIFMKWFATFFIPPTSTNQKDLTRIPTLPVCFNSAIPADHQVWLHVPLYEFLSENKILLLKDFLQNYQTITSTPGLLGGENLLYVHLIHRAIPPSGLQ